MKLKLILTTAIAAAGVGGLLADQAAALPTACSQSGPTVTCTYTSGSNPFTVPAGVFSIHVVAVAAAGSSSGATPGGPGAVVSGDLPVKAGSTLYAVVGANAGGQMEGGADGGAGGAEGDSFCLPLSVRLHRGRSGRRRRRCLRRPHLAGRPLKPPAHRRRWRWRGRHERLLGSV